MSNNNNITKKLPRKNRTHLNVSWPDKNEFWTINELVAKNKGFVTITLRVRLKKAVEAGTVSVIGDKMNGKGRPTMVYCMSPATDAVRNKAKEAGIVLREVTKIVPVANITPPVPSTSLSTPSVSKDLKSIAVNVNPTPPVTA